MKILRNFELSPSIVWIDWNYWVDEKKKSITLRIYIETYLNIEMWNSIKKMKEYGKKKIDKHDIYIIAMRVKEVAYWKQKENKMGDIKGIGSW